MRIQTYNLRLPTKDYPLFPVFGARRVVVFDKTCKNPKSEV